MTAVIRVSVLAFQMVRVGLGIVAESPAAYLNPFFFRVKRRQIALMRSYGSLFAVCQAAELQKCTQPSSGDANRFRQLRVLPHRSRGRMRVACYGGDRGRHLLFRLKSPEVPVEKLFDQQKQYGKRHACDGKVKRWVHYRSIGEAIGQKPMRQPSG